jgi:hypothetical protein
MNHHRDKEMWKTKERSGSSRLVSGLVGRLVGRLVSWFVGGLVCRLVGGLVCRLVVLVGRLVSWFVGRFIGRLVGRLVVVVMMVREEAVVFMVLIVMLVGVTREVLLLVRANEVLGLVDHRLVGGAGGASGGAGRVGILLAGDLVGGRLSGRLVRVRDDVAVREEC